MHYSLEMKEDSTFHDPTEFQVSLLAYFDKEEHMKAFYESMKEKLRYFKEESQKED